MGDPEPPQLRGPTGIRLQNGWLLAFLQGVPISGVHSRIGHHLSDFGVGMLVEQVQAHWGERLAIFLKTHRIEVDDERVEKPN